MDDRNEFYSLAEVLDGLSLNPDPPIIKIWVSPADYHYLARVTLSKSLTQEERIALVDEVLKDYPQYKGHQVEYHIQCSNFWPTGNLWL